MITRTGYLLLLVLVFCCTPISFAQFNLWQPESIEKVVLGEPVGTLICD